MRDPLTSLGIESGAYSEDFYVLSFSSTLFRRKGSGCKLYLAESYRTDGRVKQRKIYLGTLPRNLLSVLRRGRTVLPSLTSFSV